MSGAHRQRELIAGFTLGAIGLSLVLRFGVKPVAVFGGRPLHELPLIAAVVLGGAPLVVELLIKLFRREFGSDLLAGISIVTSIVLKEYLAGALVVLMLSGGEALEAYAVRSASSVLEALAKRMPSVAHRKRGNDLADLPLVKCRSATRWWSFLTRFARWTARWLAATASWTNRI